MTLSKDLNGNKLVQDKLTEQMIEIMCWNEHNRPQSIKNYCIIQIHMATSISESLNHILWKYKYLYREYDL